MDRRREVFQAISDPTRRQIIHLLSREPLNLNAVAGQFKVSRPAISRHMKILKECGLVEIKKNGRERICLARLENLNEVARWVDQYQHFWNLKLDALEDYLQKMQSIKSNPHDSP